MELWRAQAGSGKTEAILELIAETARANPLSRIWVVLPTSRQRAGFRLRLLEHLRDANLPAFNVELFNFYSLNRRLLNLLRVPVRSLGSGARQAVLRRVAVKQRLRVFEPVAAMPGFSRAVGSLISELKQARIDPDEFVRAASNAKDEELAGIYSAYQTLLQNHALVDTEGEAWLALERLLEAPPEWDAKVALLAVDGFDQFTGVQARMIKALANHAARTVVTLTVVDGREDGVGRRFTSAEAAIKADTVRELPARAHSQPAVRHLLDHAFRLGRSVDRMDSDAARTLTLIEGHSPSAEAAEVIRHIKRRLVAGQTPPDAIMVVVRDWARYQPALSSAAAAFGVPLSLQAGSPLTRHPLAAALDGIFTLPDSDFAFEPVIDALRSPYIALEGLPPELLAKVELAARKFNLRAGRESWDAALARAAQPSEDYAGRETPPILTADERDSAAEALNRLFDALPPPDFKDRVWNLVWRIEELIGTDPDHETDADAKLGFTLDIARQVRQGERVSDDLAALHAIKASLRDLLLTEDLLAAIDGDNARIVAWGDFLGDFRAALAGAELSAAPDRSGRVLVTTATEARGSAHPHVYIVGLSEGIFPAPLPVDPLYLDSESAKLLDAGDRRLLRSAADRADDDSLFFEILAQARESLTLSRPAMDGGQAWPPSALWNAVTMLIAPPDFAAINTRVSPGRPPVAERAASLPELAAALRTAHPLADLRGEHIARARQVENGRYALAENGDSPPDLAPYVADLRAAVYDDFAPRLRRKHYRWSASSINALASCAYRVFAEKLLGLEALEDPAEGADAALEGSLMHRILEETYAAFRTPQHPIAPENLDEALARLESSAREVFQNAIDRRDLIPSAIWPQQQKVIERYLTDLVRRDFSTESPVAQAFGSGTRWTLLTEKKFGDEDARPMTLTAQVNGQPVTFQLTGTIDRVDCIDNGETLRLVVIDYKRSGGTITAADVAEGRSTQIVLYAAVLEALLQSPDSPERSRWFADVARKPVEVAGGLFWSVRTGKALHTLSGAETYSYRKAKYTADELRTLTLDGIAERVERVRGGDFRPLPQKPENGQCAKYCAFADLCRICELVKP